MAGALAFVAWLIVSNTMAATFARFAPEQALAWQPHNAMALVAIAQQNLAKALAAPIQSSGNRTDRLSRTQRSAAALNRARELAERGLRFDPLVSGALTVLARVYDAQGDSVRAERLMSLAGERALRDPIAQGWLVEHALREGKFAAALPHLDALLRTHPELSERSLPLMVALASFPAAAEPLARLLATDPTWRAWFMSAVPAGVSNHAALTQFYADLLAAPRPPTEKELEPYLKRLVKDGSYKEAYDIWMKSLPTAARPTGSDLLYDGQFEHDIGGSEFDWKIQSQPGADIELTGTAGRHDRTLQIEFSGARVDFDNVSHLLLLPAGRYLLSGEFAAQALQSERGLWWRLYCVERPNETLAHTPLETESGDWRPFSAAFEIPANGCRAQELRLELPARIALEHQIAGVVSYRDIHIRALH